MRPEGTVVKARAIFDLLYPTTLTEAQGSPPELKSNFRSLAELFERSQHGHPLPRGALSSPTRPPGKE